MHECKPLAVGGGGGGGVGGGSDDCTRLRKFVPLGMTVQVDRSLTPG